MTRPRPIRTASAHTIQVARTARYYLIGDDASPAEELWIVLHGYGQLAANFVEYFAALKNGRRVIVAPEALNRYYTIPATSVPAAERPVGATWMTREARDEEIGDYVRYLDQLHATMIDTRPDVRTIVVGFSQGGATATRWAVRGSTRIDRLILWGALLPPDVALTAIGSGLRGATLDLVIGDEDQYITAEALAAEEARLRSAGIVFGVTRYAGGHTIRREVLRMVSGGAPETGEPTT